ncbi:hypothetical protein KC926_02460 [Candidatus Kaiserbacteria bacterium]|nr:hypothetical protein [Candidatus Kaiserbacteria bacterium]
MKKFSEQLHKKAQSVKLQTAEKNELRERLVSYMEYHPLPAEMKSSAPKKVSAPDLFTEAFTSFQIPFAAIFKSSAVAAAVVLVVVPFMAERSVPGDTLYAVKVQFNEEIRSTLTFDSYQKVEWETERLNRRIAEARLLANEGRLTEEVEAEVAKAVQTHTENAQREIEVLRAEDEDEATMASIALDTTLEVQSNSLKSVEATDLIESDDELEVSSKPANLIADAIDKSRSESEARNASTTLPAYGKLMARVEQNTTRVYELLDSLKKVTDPAQLADVTRRIEDIERAIAETITLSAEDEMQARQDLIGVLQRTQRLIVFMTELEVSAVVDIETLVPVVLTNEEELVIKNDHTEKVALKLEKIKSSAVLVEDDQVSEKVDFAIEKISNLSEQMASSSTFANFKSLSGEAIALANDTLIILEKNVVPKAVEEVVSTSTATSTVEIEVEVATNTATITPEVVE